MPFEEKRMLSKSSIHAIRAMVVLAKLDQPARADVTSISQKIHAPKMYLYKLMRRLSRAGLLDGRIGRGGGFRLTRSANQISAFEVLEPFEHFDKGTNGEAICPPICDEPVPAAYHDPWETIQVQYLRILHDTSLADLAVDSLALQRQVPANAQKDQRREVDS